MSYLTQDEIANNTSMLHRVAQCATGEGVGIDAEPSDPLNMGHPMDADRWAFEHRRQWASAPGWDDAWDYSKNTHPAPDPLPDNYVPFDPGKEGAVITDGQILAQVQGMLGE